MKPALILCLALAAPAAFAEGSVPAEEGPAREGIDLIERGAQLLFRQFAEDIGPELGRLAEELGRELDALPGYHPPEVLPNGDIIIRRRTPLEPAPEPGGEVDL